MPKLIGNNPNQVSTNGMLGNMAFQNREAVSVGTLVTTGNAGLNTAAPTAPLDVTTVVTGAAGISVRGRSTDDISDISFKSNSAATTYAQIQGRTTELRLQTSLALPITFYTNLSERMRINAAGDVGIGTNAPAYRFDVALGGTAGAVVDVARVYSAAGGVSTPRLLFGSAANDVSAAIGAQTTTATSGDLTFYTETGGTLAEKMRLDGAGNLGLGVSPSAWGSVFRAIQFGTTGSAFAWAGTTNIGANFYYDTAGTGYYLTSNFAGHYQMADGQHRWFTAPTGTAGAAITFTQRMTLDGSGNLGIGITPTAKLHVASGNAILGTAVGNTTTVPDQTALEYTTDTLPTIRPTLLLDFVNTSVLDSRITFTRSSTGTFVGRNGLLQTAATNVPRFDYDPATLAPRGLLIEEQRTNLVTYSAEFDNAAWTKTNATVTANSATAPDGTSTADSLIENTVNGVHDARRTVSASALTTYTQSIFVKASGRTRGQMQMFGNSGGSTINYDLTAGTATAAGAYGGWTGASATITNYGNGWYRVTNTATTNAGLTTLVAAYLLADASGSGSYTGDGTSGMFYWGAQLEAGAFATSYIPTVASQVTRSGDQPTLTGANVTNWVNQSEGTFAFEADVFAATVSNKRLLGVNLTASTIGFVGNSGNFGIFDGTTAVSGNTVSSNIVFKGASAYDTVNKVAVLNAGAAVSTARSTSFPLTPISSLQLGWDGSQPVNSLNGHIRRIAYYPIRLSNSVLQGMTR